MKAGKKRAKVVRIKTKKGKVVTFKIPQGTGGWYKWFKSNGQLMKNAKYVGVTIAMLAVINMHEVFQTIEFSQEITGTLIWAFVLLGMLSWGFR